MDVAKTHVPHPPMMESKQVSDLDFDMLVTHVENTISKDKRRQHHGFTPQELMLRSNPGLFSWEKLAFPDLTNPREMYTILSSKSKSIEDLEAKFKKELVKSVQSSGSFPKLSRTVSMNDLEHTPGKGHKASDINHRRMNMLELKRHNTSIVEGLRKAKESDAENVRAVNLPHIERHANSKGANHKARETCKADDDELPTIGQTNVNIQKNVDVQQTETGAMKLEHNTNGKPQVSFSDTKLEKWFSEMPSEIFDKAQRALMEESIQERLQEFKRKRSKKANFPNPNFNICIGSKHQKVPNTYLELRVDSFGRHLQAGKDDKRNRYKLHQKSLHNLKMREGTDVDLHERIRREETFPRLAPNKSKTHVSLVKQNNKAELEVTTAKSKKDAIKMPTDAGVKTLYINDRLDKAIGQRVCQKHGMNNYEDYTERLIATKEVHYQDFLKTILHSPPTSQCDPDEVRIGDFAIERENTKATIVNLELKKVTPQSRIPLHIGKSLKDASKSNNLQPNSNGIEEEPIKQTGESEETTAQQELTHDKIITKIPTAQSTRTSESRSSTSSKTNKEAMKKFNQLEVFAEVQQAAGRGNTQFGNITESNLRHLGHSYNSAFPSSSKVDTKHQNRHVQEETEDENRLKEIRRPEQDVVFRFEPGEVFISRKNPNKTLTKTVASDRARVIYGKVVNSAMGKKMNTDKHISKKQSIRDYNSNFYRAEVSKYESRALDDCVTAITPSHDNETDPMLIVTSTSFHELQDREKQLSNNNLKAHKPNEASMKRDVATETDIIGSPKESQLDTHFYRPPPSDRSGSGLSDFIIDDNDGESLESDSDDKDISPDIRQRSNHSV